MSPEAPYTPDEPGRAEAPETLPTFAFNRLMVRKAYFEQIERAPIAEGEEKPQILSSTLDLMLTTQVHKEQTHGQVTLATIVHPDLKWQPYRIEVTVSGVFAAQNASRELFEEFCKQAVPSILFPYVRQIVQTLTSDGAYGVVRINPINVQQLVTEGWANVGDEPTSSEP